MIRKLLRIQELMKGYTIPNCLPLIATQNTT